jgi:hypothetical protein
MSKFYQNAGPFGPMLPSPLKSTWLPTSNPMLNTAVGLNPRPVVRPQPTTATIAGRANIGCCGGCSADYRRA